jgi:predicted glycoside hydrolase/deacetylase ChbG (UPF0249 family)
MSKIILFNADDWGLSESIHAAIVDLHAAHAVDAAGIMMGQAFTDLAVQYARTHPTLRVGLHLFATDRDCRPLTMPTWSRFWPEDMLVNAVAGLPSVRRVILEEADAQLAAWKSTGLPLHFINSHFHFHAQHHVLEPLIDLVFRHFPKFTGWVRLGDSRTMPGSALHAGGLLTDLLESALFVRQWRGRSNDTLWGVDQSFANQPGSIVKAADSLESGFHEFFFHPGRSWKLTDEGKDREALMELATLLPAEVRNVDQLPFPSNH